MTQSRSKSKKNNKEKQPNTMANARMRAALATKEVKTVFRSQQYNLQMQVRTLVTSTTSVFTSYIRFAPQVEESYTVLNAPLTMNNDPRSATTIGVISDSELASWSNLFAKMQVQQIIVNYTPGVTNSVASTAPGGYDSAFAMKLVYGPNLIDIDSIIDTSNVVTVGSTTATIPKLKIRPHIKETSMYKPWSCSFTPVYYEYLPGYTTTSTPLIRALQSPKLSLTSTGTVSYLDGFLISAPAIVVAGDVSGALSFTPNAVGELFVLGKIDFTYVVAFSDRI